MARNGRKIAIYESYFFSYKIAKKKNESKKCVLCGILCHIFWSNEDLNKLGIL